MIASVDDIHARRPDWARGGSVSRNDAQFLFDRVIAARCPRVVEIGTAAGVSTAVLCHSLDVAHRDLALGDEFRVISYDQSTTCYVDRSKPVGCAIEDMLPAELVQHVEFRNPATAIDLHKHHAPDSIGLLFIDASHQHPWPTLDVLATLDLVRPGAEVILHDINLPLIAPEFPDWGVKHVFDKLDLPKLTDRASDPPNIGSIIIPRDRAAVRDQLLRIADAHEWQTDVPDEVTAPLLGR
jgi:predicted O-methyltransferase YrrM